MNKISLIFAIFLAALLLPSCIEDRVSDSPADQPEFSTDTLDLGEVFTAQGTPTRRFTVYNRHDRIITLQRVAVRGEAAQYYRLNVDGTAGREIGGIDIRPNDSVMVFVEATLPENGQAAPLPATAYIDFITAGQTRSVVITADTRDIVRLRGVTITADTTFTADRPIVVYDSLCVADGATLTLGPGVRLLFHDKAELRVDGTLVANGTPDRPIDLTGDRTGNVVASIPYDIMSGQWEGVWLRPGSKGNALTHTTIRNSVGGVQVDSLAELTITSCVLRNATAYPLAAAHATVSATGCEIAEGGMGALYLRGGKATLDHCTLSNNYLFAAVGGPVVQLDHIDGDSDDGSALPYLSASLTNSIVYGFGGDLNRDDLTGTDITLRRCLLRSAGTDDANFVDCIWDKDPMFLVDRPAYIFDYHILPESPAAHAATPLDPAAIVLSPLGEAATPHLGAYPPAEP